MSFRYLSEQLTNRLLDKKVISEENQEICQYGFEKLFSLIFTLITVLIIGVILGEFYLTVIFLITFTLLRSYAGGYHASTKIKCFLLSNGTIAVSLSVIKYIDVPILISLWLLIFTSVVILVLSPVEAENKPLDEIEYAVYKKRTVVAWFFETCVIIILLIAGADKQAETMLMAYVLVSVILLLGKIQRKNEKCYIS